MTHTLAPSLGKILMVLFPLRGLGGFIFLLGFWGFALAQKPQDFPKYKGKLPPPLTGAKLVRGFGKTQHPSLRHVSLDNAGIRMRATNNLSVKAVFAGKVKNIVEIQGMKGKVIMLQHGAYYTVYVHTQQIEVLVGDNVRQGQTLAKVCPSADGKPDIEFQIWHGSRKLDPTDWLKR